MFNREKLKEIITSGEQKVVTNTHFSDYEFLYINNREIHDEQGYKWNLEDLKNLPNEGWELWLDLDNLIKKKIKMPRNKLCKCGSGIKFKKCCWLTQDKKIRIQNEKVKCLNKVKEAIKNNKSVKQMVLENKRIAMSTISSIDFGINEEVFKL